jgi:hypothetical protein
MLVQAYCFMEFHAMKKILFIVIFLVVAGNVPAAELLYQIETDDSSDSFYLTITENEDGTTYLSRYQSLTQVYMYDRQRRTVEWQYQDTKTSTSYTAVRNGTRILVTGMLNGESIEKELAVPAYIWGQNSEYALLDFVKSGQRSTEFFVIKPGDLSVNKMKFRREGSEEILHNGTMVNTVRYKAQLQGLLSLLWQAHYWYRLPDYGFILYKTSGAPGIPATEIRLVSESD